MASILRVQERTVLDVVALRARMAANGVKVRELAEAAGMDSQAVSAILSGRDYFGPVRQARILAAVRALGLDDPDNETQSA